MTAEMFMFGNLGCSSCALELEKAVRALPGMVSARVIHAAGAMDVEYDTNILHQDDIRALVKQMGIDVATVVPGAGAHF